MGSIFGKLKVALPRCLLLFLALLGGKAHFSYAAEKQDEKLERIFRPPTVSQAEPKPKKTQPPQKFERFGVRKQTKPRVKPLESSKKVKSLEQGLNRTAIASGARKDKPQPSQQNPVKKQAPIKKQTLVKKPTSTKNQASEGANVKKPKRLQKEEPANKNQQTADKAVIKSEVEKENRPQTDAKETKTNNTEELDDLSKADDSNAPSSDSELSETTSDTKYEEYTDEMFYGEQPDDDKEASNTSDFDEKNNEDQPSSVDDDLPAEPSEETTEENIDLNEDASSSDAGQETGDQGNSVSEEEIPQEENSEANYPDDEGDSLPPEEQEGSGDGGGNDADDSGNYSDFASAEAEDQTLDDSSGVDNGQGPEGDENFDDGSPHQDFEEQNMPGDANDEPYGEPVENADGGGADLDTPSDGGNPDDYNQIPDQDSDGSGADSANQNPDAQSKPKIGEKLKGTLDKIFGVGSDESSEESSTSSPSSSGGASNSGAPVQPNVTPNAPTTDAPNAINGVPGDSAPPGPDEGVPQSGDNAADGGQNPANEGASDSDGVVPEFHPVPYEDNPDQFDYTNVPGVVAVDPSNDPAEDPADNPTNSSVGQNNAEGAKEPKQNKLTLQASPNGPPSAASRDLGQVQQVFKPQPYQYSSTEFDYTDVPDVPSKNSEGAKPPSANDKDEEGDKDEGDDADENEAESEADNDEADPDQGSEAGTAKKSLKLNMKNVGPFKPALYQYNPEQFDYKDVPEVDGTNNDLSDQGKPGIADNEEADKDFEGDDNSGLSDDSFVDEESDEADDSSPSTQEDKQDTSINERQLDELDSEKPYERNDLFGNSRLKQKSPDDEEPRRPMYRQASEREKYTTKSKQGSPLTYFSAGNLKSSKVAYPGDEMYENVMAAYNGVPYWSQQGGKMHMKWANEDHPLYSSLKRFKVGSTYWKAEGDTLTLKRAIDGSDLDKKLDQFKNLHLSAMVGG